MPTFETTTGKPIWVPAQAVMRAEPGEGGLSTVLCIMPPPGAPPGSELRVEVKGRVVVHGEVLDQCLQKERA